MITFPNILSREGLARYADEDHELGRRVVFTNGCFDILHIGHIRCLQEASDLGDTLYVGINSDSSVMALKGVGRPIVPQAERAEMVAAIDGVTAVCIFDELTPENLIRIVRPDIHVKGGDYAEDQLIEAELVRSLGGEVKILSLTPGKSTTGLIKALCG